MEAKARPVKKASRKQAQGTKEQVPSSAKQTPRGSGTVTRAEAQLLLKQLKAVQMLDPKMPELNPTFRVIFAQVCSWSMISGLKLNEDDLLDTVIAAYRDLDAPRSIKAKPVPDTLHGPQMRSLNRALASLVSLEAQVRAAADIADAAAMVPVAAYYAVYNAIVCERTLAGGRITSHSAAAAHYVDFMRRGFVPRPYDIFAVGGSPATFAVHSASNQFKPFVPKVPRGRQLYVAQDLKEARMRVGQSLVTTRKEGRSPDYYGAKRAGKPARHDTTIVDYLFRLRHRAQYADWDAFNVGASAHMDLVTISVLLAEVAYATALPLMLTAAHRLGSGALEAHLKLRPEYRAASRRIAKLIVAMSEVAD